MFINKRKGSDAVRSVPRVNITCSQEPLQEPVLSIVEMPTYIHTTDNNQIARGELLKMFFKKIQQRL